MAEPHTRDSVADYYDKNTRRFLLVGGGGAVHSIHRQLWGPGVHSAEEAACTIDRLIADRIDEAGLDPRLTILDMGCGVGGTLLRLATIFPDSRLRGVTISRKQHAIATRLIGAEGLAGRCRVDLGDFLSHRVDIEANVIVAIESFVHSHSAARFFSAASASLSAGGYVMVADDFLAVGPDALDAGARRRVADLRRGWRVPGLCTVEACVMSAAAAGLAAVSEEDLTPMIRLERPRDRVIALLGPLFGRLGLAAVPLFGNTIGGAALRAGLRDGLFAYKLLVFRNIERRSHH